MRRILALALLLTASAGLALGSAEPEAHATRTAEPRLATCFWEGPISTRRLTTRGFDGRNFNFPEESATYWLARFNLAEDDRLAVAGRYPHGRYMSLTAYSEGTPIDALSDIAIEPRAGAVNPFEAGARRTVAKRGWRVQVVNAARPSDPAARAPNTLYVKPAGGAPIELAYRVYEADLGLGLTGGVELPRPRLTLADGGIERGASACAAINDPNRAITVQTIPAAVWKAARATPGCDAATNPAYDPPRWERFFNIDYASLAVITDCTAAGRAARRAMGADLEGGFYSNGDSAYVYSHLSRLFGPVLVVNGTLPDTPQTYGAPPRMPAGQVRFWSLCTGESRVTTRTPDCLSDRQILRQSGRQYTVAVSTAADRPANAAARCGIAWLEWGDRGDGAGDPNYGLLIMRNMLASPDFAEAIQNVPQPGAERDVMGPYFPESEYTTREGFESRGCPESSRSAAD